nr:hypothetical protein BaRGS_024686 [Batillaria attramentaria]
MEYVGELLDYKEFVRRTRQYAKQGMMHHYFMALNADEWTVNGELRVGFFTKKPVTCGEELTFDYQFEFYGEPQKCYCGSENCRGFIGSIKNQPVQNKKVEKRTADLFEDDMLDDDIESMMRLENGMQNQKHVLEVCRLMVRAEKPEHRLSILRIIQMLSVLKKLPITNRTILKESKIMTIVEKWANLPPPPPPAPPAPEAEAESQTEAGPEAETEEPDPYAKWKKKKVDKPKKRDSDDDESKKRSLLATPQGPRLTKEERRQLFEAQVKAEDELAAERAQMQRQQMEAFLQQQFFYQDPAFAAMHGLTPDPNLLAAQGQGLATNGSTAAADWSTWQTQWEPPAWERNSPEDMDFDLPEPELEEDKKRKMTTTAAADTSSEVAKKIKEQFRRQLTHHVMAKELKHCRHVEDLEVNENVKAKAKDYVRKYMSRYGPEFKTSSSPQLDDFGL